MNTCDKCRENIIKECSVLTEGGKLYVFCPFCYELALHLPTNSLASFVRKDGNWLKEKIARAKEKREKGEGEWKNHDDKELDE